MSDGLDGELIDYQNEKENDTHPKGFLNPETLAKAQETRRQNKLTPSSLVGEEMSLDEPERKKRGRKPGQTYTRKRDLSGIESILVGIHAMLSTATAMPELSIEQAEAHVVAEAIANVSEQYKIKLDGKAGAIAGLVYALGIVYGPRAVAITIRLRNERKQEQEQKQHAHSFAK